MDLPIIFLINRSIVWSITGQKFLRHDTLKHKVTSSNALFCLANHPKCKSRKFSHWSTWNQWIFFCQKILYLFIHSFESQLPPMLPSFFFLTSETLHLYYWKFASSVGTGELGPKSSKLSKDGLISVVFHMVDQLLILNQNMLIK